MKFSESKFFSFSFENQIKILLDFISDIEKAWQDVVKRKNLLIEFAKCLSYLKRPHFPIQENNFNPDIELNEFFDLVMPFVHEFGNGLKDTDIIVYSSDGLRKAKEKIPLFLILDNLRSVFNVGALFRTAECFGVQKIFLCGYTPTPENPKLRKTSMGTEKHIEWEHLPQFENVLNHLHKMKILVYALETEKSAINIHKTSFPKPCALLVGNEALGISTNILKLVDKIVTIPLSGWKNSLNVAIATAVCLYEISRQWII